jgi:SAM-dependent methyltransferase
MPALSVIQRAVRARISRLGLRPGAMILDAPTGEGALAKALAQDGYDVHALDMDPSAQTSLGERFRLANLNEPLPYPDARFDLVACVEGIEHLENPWGLLRELRRMLAPRGTLILTTPNTTSLRSRVRFLGSGFYHTDKTPLDESARHPLHHVGLRTFPEWRYMLHTSGFRIGEVGASHVKPVSYLYAPWAPWMWLYTTVAFRKQKNAEQRARNLQIRRELHSRALLFGENLLLVASAIEGRPL